MAFIRLNDLKLIKEGCIKPKDYECRPYQTCYNDEYQCRYFRQVFRRKSDDLLLGCVENFYIVREGNKWDQTKRGDL